MFVAEPASVGRPPARPGISLPMGLDSEGLALGVELDAGRRPRW